MIFYIILLILFTVIFVISIGTFIAGLIKKKNVLLIIGAVLFVGSIVGGAISGMAYSKEVLNYVKSTEFQKDVNKGSEIVGQTIGSVSSGISKGITSTIDDEAIHELARRSAAILGKSIKTVASGFDSTIGAKNIYVDQSLSDAGFELGRASEKINANTGELKIFITYKKDFKGTLLMTNYDQTGKKIDIAKKEVDVKAGVEKVEVFSFLHSDFGLTTYYILSNSALAAE